MNFLKAVGISLLFGYLLFAFVTWESNPANWSDLDRIYFVLAMLFTIFLVLAIFMRIKELKDSKEKRRERKAEAEQTKDIVRKAWAKIELNQKKYFKIQDKLAEYRESRGYN